MIITQLTDLLNQPTNHPPTTPSQCINQPPTNHILPHTGIHGQHSVELEEVGDVLGILAQQVVVEGSRSEGEC